MDSISLLSAVGTGALISIPLQYYFNERAKRKTILFQEKKEAFVGLLTAYQRAAVEPSEKHSKEFAYWQLRSFAFIVIVVTVLQYLVVDIIAINRTLIQFFGVWSIGLFSKTVGIVLALNILWIAPAVIHLPFVIYKEVFEE